MIFRACGYPDNSLCPSDCGTFTPNIEKKNTCQSSKFKQIYFKKIHSMNTFWFIKILDMMVCCKMPNGFVQCLGQPMGK